MTAKTDKTNPMMSRRRMLTRLGLTATALYAAPVMLQISEARASGFSRGSHSRASYSRPSHSRPSFSHGEHRRRSKAFNS